MGLQIENDATAEVWDSSEYVTSPIRSLPRKGKTPLFFEKI